MTRTVTVSLDPRSREVWEENLRILQRVQPILHARLENYVTERGHLFEHTESEEENGAWVGGLAQTPFFQPRAFPPMPWRNASEAAGYILFVYGAGNAPWLYALLNSLPKGLISVVVIEPSLGILAYALHCTLAYRLISEGCRLSFIASAEDGEMGEALRYGVMDMGTYVVSRLAAYCHPGETALWPDSFREFQAKIHARLVTRLLQLGNSMEDTLLGLRQMALLSPWIALGPRVRDIAGVYRGRPFIWVASGPSLDKNFRLLKENRDRAVIVCADTAAAKLLGEGIVPHIVVALERGVMVHTYLSKLYSRFPGEAKKILLVAQSVCVPEVAGKWPGPVAVVGKAELSLDRWIVGSVLGGDLIVSGLSVAHMGVWLAVFLGASSLALIGQDLAFAPGRVSHAENTVTGETAKAEASGEHRILRGVYEVPGALGGTVETHEIWRLFLSIMEDHVPFLGCPLFDCTEGGALIRGSTVTPLQEWMDAHLPSVEPFELSPAEAIFRVLPDAFRRGELAAAAASRTEEALRSLDKASDALDKMEEEIRRAAAPALTAARRQAIAAGVYRALDAFHREFPTMDFIGQGLGGANALAIAQNRFLSDVPSIRAWTAAFEDLFKAYRISLKFMGFWFRYVMAAIPGTARHWDEGCSLTPLPFYPEGPDPKEGLPASGKPEEPDAGLPGLSALGLRDLEVLDSARAKPFLLDNLLARSDHKWWRFRDPSADWRVARFLADYGRFAEASYFMARFDEARTGTDSPEQARDEDAQCFYREYARMLMSHDLCRATDWDRVFAILPGAKDPELEEEAAREKKRDAEERIRLLKSTKGTFAFDYMPQYAVEELTQLVDDVVRLVGSTLYQKGRVLELGDGALLGERLKT